MFLVPPGGRQISVGECFNTRGARRVKPTPTLVASVYPDRWLVAANNGRKIAKDVKPCTLFISPWRPEICPVQFLAQIDPPLAVKPEGKIGRIQR